VLEGVRRKGGPLLPNSAFQKGVTFLGGLQEGGGGRNVREAGKKKLSINWFAAGKEKLRVVRNAVVVERGEWTMS